MKQAPKQKNEKKGWFGKVYGRLNKVVFFICLSFSIVLITVAFFIPPTAVVDGSVLAAVGEIFAYCALGTVIEAIDKGHDITLQKGDTSMTINKDDNKEIE